MSTLALSAFKMFACLVLASTSMHAFGSDKFCPGDVASLQYRIVNQHQMVVDVEVNQSGPFSFLFDTGTQMTMVDPSLASELNLKKEEGSATVASVGVNAEATFARAERIAAGSHWLPDMKVLVYDLSNLQLAGVSVRGVLGEDFLERFDVLIDNAHGLLCLDDTGAMRERVTGRRTSLLAQPAGNGSVPDELVISARLSDGMRPVRLKLDSGANASFLYNTSEYMALGLYRGVSLQGGGAHGTQRTFTALPLQTMKIGSVEMARVQFVTLAGVQKDSHTADFDGLLTLGLFRRIFIDRKENFVILDPL